MSKAIICQDNIFQGSKIRNVIHKGEVWFSVVDVIRAIKNPKDPSDYWTSLKKRIEKEETTPDDLSGVENQFLQKIQSLKLKAEDGKQRETDCVNEETLYELLYEIPSKKTRAFKQFSAKLVKEYLDTKRGLKPQQDPQVIQQSKETRKSLGDAMKECGKNGLQIIGVTDQIYRGLFSKSSKELRKERFVVMLIETKAKALLMSEYQVNGIVSSGDVGRTVKMLACGFSGMIADLHNAPLQRKISSNEV